LHLISASSQKLTNSFLQQLMGLAFAVCFDIKPHEKPCEAILFFVFDHSDMKISQVGSQKFIVTDVIPSDPSSLLKSKKKKKFKIFINRHVMSASIVEKLPIFLRATAACAAGFP